MEPIKFRIGIPCLRSHISMLGFPWKLNRYRTIGQKRARKIKDGGKVVYWSRSEGALAHLILIDACSRAEGLAI